LILPYHHSDPSRTQHSAQAPWCRDQNLGPPQLFSRSCAPGGRMCGRRNVLGKNVPHPFVLASSLGRLFAPSELRLVCMRRHDGRQWERVGAKNSRTVSACVRRNGSSYRRPRRRPRAPIARLRSLSDSARLDSVALRHDTAACLAPVRSTLIVKRTASQTHVSNVLIEI